MSPSTTSPAAPEPSATPPGGKPSDQEIFSAHQGGKLRVALSSPIRDGRDLSMVYTPGVAQVSRAIAKNPELARSHTWASRLVAVVSDGSAVLGLGDIGPAASLPVMEGKSALFKTFGDLDSIPIVLNTSDVDEIVETIVRISPSFGAVNLEDISAPRCFELEQKLIDALDIPVMHDDQHGTAVVVLAALTNAAHFTDKQLADLKVVISGAGAAGIAITEILLEAGVNNILLLDSKGILHPEREGLQGVKQTYAERTNPEQLVGGTAAALTGADVFIGVSSAQLPEAHLEQMNEDAIVFALSNPDPEIAPDVAARYAAVVATGRSDFANQINNVSAFPGIFRGALDAGARRITPQMKLAAANAIADLVGDDLSADYIIPAAMETRVAPAVASAVQRAAQVQ